MTQHLQAKERRRIEKLYLSGVKPGEIARRVGMKPASLRQHLYREGLTKRQAEIQATKARTASEVLEHVRQHSVDDFEAVLGLLADGLKIDAQKLRNGWNLVQDAAGASSLMRAKSSLLERTSRFFGIDDRADLGQPKMSLSVFVAHGILPEKVPQPVGVDAAHPVTDESSAGA